MISGGEPSAPDDEEGVIRDAVRTVVAKLKAKEGVVVHCEGDRPNGNRHCVRLIPAVSFERVLAEAKARYVVGLTATPQRRDGHHPIAEMQLGPVRFAVDPKSQAAQRPFAHTLVVRETGFTPARDKTSSIQDLYAALAADEQRNHLILNDVIHALEQGRSPILMTERKDHLEYFAGQAGNSFRSRHA